MYIGLSCMCKCKARAGDAYLPLAGDLEPLGHGANMYACVVTCMHVHWYAHASCTCAFVHMQRMRTIRLMATSSRSAITRASAAWRSLYTAALDSVSSVDALSTSSSSDDRLKSAPAVVRALATSCAVGGKTAAAWAESVVSTPSGTLRSVKPAAELSTTAFGGTAGVLNTIPTSTAGDRIAIMRGIAAQLREIGMESRAS